MQLQIAAVVALLLVINCALADKIAPPKWPAEFRMDVQVTGTGPNATHVELPIDGRGTVFYDSTNNQVWLNRYINIDSRRRAS